MREYTLIEDDLLNADADFICHQVNCQGKMNSGVAKAIRSKYPRVYDMYMWQCKPYIENGNNQELLGKIQIVGLNTSVMECKLDPKCRNGRNFDYCINMFAQANYGYDGKQYTSIEAFKKCLELINRHCFNKVVAFPWLIGCVRGGADWDDVLPMILETLTDVKEIYFYKL